MIETTMVHVCIFEDREAEQLFPLTLTKPAYDLLLGSSTLFEKIFRHFGHANISLHCRDYLKECNKKQHPGLSINTINMGTPCLFINSRVLLSEKLLDHLHSIDDKFNTLYTFKGQVVAAYVRGDLLEAFCACLRTLPSSAQLIQVIRSKSICKELESVHLIEYPWHLLSFNEEALRWDFQFNNQPGIIKGEIKPFTALYNENNIFIDKDTEIEDFVVLNAKPGPIYIENNVYIEANTRLEGPLYIGAHTQILGGKIKNSSIGRHCKVAGEVSASIFQSFSNKAHGGFIGNSYLGEWVNLGAFTTTSNLRNNYSPVTVHTHQGSIKTDERFLGSIIGDYVKTGIQTTLNTGTVISTGSALFDTGFHDKYIPPFSWGSPKNYATHHLDAFFNTTAIMMNRRNRSLSDSQKQLLHFLFQHALRRPNESAFR